MKLNNRTGERGQERDFERQPVANSDRAADIDLRQISCRRKPDCITVDPRTLDVDLTYFVGRNSLAASELPKVNRIYVPYRKLLGGKANRTVGIRCQRHA